MRLSYVLITHNRREPILRTLTRLRAVTPLPRGAWEAVVVDNASTDRTAEAIAEAFPEVRVLRRPVNEGSAARNVGVATASGETVLFLDDDSSPRAGTVEAGLVAMESNPRLAVLGGRVLLPAGDEDASALPIVPPACAMFVRRAAFVEVGGFCPFFFRQAEEHDLVLRLLRGGWTARRDEALTFDHEKVARSRDGELILRMDLRNNLVLAHRHLPRPLRARVRRDWLRRYAALLSEAGHPASTAAGLREARTRVSRERPLRPADPATIEVAFGLERQHEAVRAWSRARGIRRVVIADHSKTLFATYEACLGAGLEVVAIADGHLAYRGLSYRGVPILPDEAALALAADGVVLSNLNPARVDARLRALRGATTLPVLRLTGREDVSPPAAPPRFGAVVLGRMESSRLPGKVLTPVLGRPLLRVVVDRLRLVQALRGNLVIATTTRPADDAIARFAEAIGVPVYRGDADDVAGRMLGAARMADLDYAFRVNADSPCVEPSLLAEACERATAEDLDFVTNLRPRSFPYGVAVELVRVACFASLEAWSTSPEDREHVMPVVYRHLAGLRHANLSCEHGDLSHVQLTIDTADDLRRFQAAASSLGPDWWRAPYLDHVAATAATLETAA